MLVSTIITTTDRRSIAVHPRALLIVRPGIVEHQSHVATVLPRVGVLVVTQLVFNCRQVHRLLDHIEVILFSLVRFGCQKDIALQL